MKNYLQYSGPNTICEAVDWLQKRKISSVELCKLFIDRVQEIDSEIHAFLYFSPDTILRQAQESDMRRQRGIPLSPYDGIPIAIKDNILVQGEPATCGSKILEGFRSPYDATAIVRLKQKGFIPFGRTNMDEFAMGSTGKNSAYQFTRNPRNLQHVTGGSSSGSAAAVASGQALAALGSDTGGSIRQPAGFCGVLGLKPTYGRVSRYGLVAYASSLDQIGPICRDAQDAAILLKIISGQDPHDATSLPYQVPDYLDNIHQFSVKGLKIGWPTEFFNIGGIDPLILQHLEQVRDEFIKNGAECVEVHFPHLPYVVAVYYIIATAEASSNLARFDGIRYGKRIQSPSSTLQDVYYQTREQGFGPEVKRRIILGTYVLSAGYYDAYYVKAQKVRTLIREDFQKAFTVCDLILAPVSPIFPPTVDAVHDPLTIYLADIFTIPVNLAGICGITVPSKKTNPQGLPLSVQLIGNSLQEGTILGAAYWLQQQEG